MIVAALVIHAVVADYRSVSNNFKGLYLTFSNSGKSFIFESKTSLINNASKTTNMKQLLFCLVLSAMFSCNSDKKQTNAETPAAETGKMGNGEMKDGISDYTNNKEGFILTCHVDASNVFGGEHVAQVDQFCECAWEKTKGKYPGSVVASKSKLANDPLLKDCYESALKK